MVYIRRGGNTYHLHSRVSDQLPVIAEYVRHAVLFSKRRSFAGRALAHGRDLHILTPSIAKQVHEAKTGADDTYAKRVVVSLRHRSPPIFPSVSVSQCGVAQYGVWVGDSRLRTERL